MGKKCGGSVPFVIFYSFHKVVRAVAASSDTRLMNVFDLAGESKLNSRILCALVESFPSLQHSKGN